jgi:hypothetical protein
MTVDRQMGLVIVTPEGKVSSNRSIVLTTRKQRRYSRGCSMTRRGIRASCIVSCPAPSPMLLSAYGGVQVPLRPVEVSLSLWFTLSYADDEIAHQIRVHLQYLGHPIDNDPLYSHDNIWGPSRGKGGVDLVPQPDIPHLASALASRQIGDQKSEVRQLEEISRKIDLEDREYSNIDITSPIRLSAQARDVIAKLRRARDEQEDWIK